MNKQDKCGIESSVEVELKTHCYLKLSTYIKKDQL
jgi:hypothetical protein